MDHYQHIYAHDAARYERLIAREDHQGNLFAALMDIHPFDGATIVEFGAGTGRVTRIMSVLAHYIHAFDQARAMLSEAQRVLEESGMENWSLAQADHRAMPVQAGIADIAVEGWSFGHVVGWHPDAWQTQLNAMLAEMRRVTKPDGTLILIETLGTGRRTPQPPNDALAAMYAHLEAEHGFAHRWIRTDFHFESAGEADELVRFFFGAEAADDWVGGQRTRIPECTGLWWKRRDDR